MKRVLALALAITLFRFSVAVPAYNTAKTSAYNAGYAAGSSIKVDVSKWIK